MNECSVADLLGGNPILAGLSLELLKLKLQLIDSPFFKLRFFALAATCIGIAPSTPLLNLPSPAATTENVVPFNG